MPSWGHFLIRTRRWQTLLRLPDSPPLPCCVPCDGLKLATLLPVWESWRRYNSHLTEKKYLSPDTSHTVTAFILAYNPAASCSSGFYTQWTVGSTNLLVKFTQIMLRVGISILFWLGWDWYRWIWLKARLWGQFWLCLMKASLVLLQCGWYWGPMNWEDAEMKLKGKPDGSFLVRDSSDPRYILSLSFRSQGVTHHTRMEHYRGEKFSFSKPTVIPYLPWAWAPTEGWCLSVSKINKAGR